MQCLSISWFVLPVFLSVCVCVSMLPQGRDSPPLAAPVFPHTCVSSSSSAVVTELRSNLLVTSIFCQLYC